LRAKYLICKGRTTRARSKPGVVKTYSLAVSRAKVAFRRMFLRQTIRKKDGKEHRYFSVVENKRVVGGRVVQRHVLYLGEINDTQELAWRKSIEVFDEGAARPRTLSLFPEDRCEGLLPDASIVRLKLSQVRLHRPRQWGACWLAVTLWRELHLDRFWAERLPASRKGTRWDQVLFVLAAYRLLAPGSEWRLHREWFERSALADLLGADFVLAEIHKLYACHDRLLAHKQALFDHLVGRWRDLFNISFDVLLYDLTSTYFEADPPFPEDDKRRYGYAPLRSDRLKRLENLRTGDGRALAPRLKAEIVREIKRLEVVLEMISTVEAERDAILTEKKSTHLNADKIKMLAKLKAIGAEFSTTLVGEVFYREFANRRQLGSYVGLASRPFCSGSLDRDQGISKAGNPKARVMMIELAWAWLRYQPESALSRWFRERVGNLKGRPRRIAIVAMARKLLVALWHYLQTGVVPTGAELKAQRN
jgi:Transposase IS116/IS110/IS902 family